MVPRSILRHDQPLLLSIPFFDHTYPITGPVTFPLLNRLEVRRGEEVLYSGLSGKKDQHESIVDRDVEAIFSKEYLQRRFAKD